jgi:hypothetical protein
MSSLSPGTYLAADLFTGTALGQVQVDAQGGLVYAPSGSMGAHETRYIRLLDSASISLDEPSAVLGLRAIPNPARELLRIEGLDPTLGWKLRTFATSGRELMSYSLRPAEFELSVAALPAGVYFLNIEQAGRTQILRVVVL